MAIDTFLRCTLDPAAANKKDGADHVHQVARNTSNGGSVTLAFDKTAVGSKTILRSAVTQILRAIDGGNELTA